MTQPGAVEPSDIHNEALIQQVHPHDWINPEPSGRYNFVVIGAGTAGLVTAAGAAGLGAKVALVERHLMGGDCLNVGCVPSKALIRSARAAADAREAERFGVRVPGSVEVDFAAVMERMRKLRSEISRHDSARRFRDLGVDVFLGDARFSGPDSVEVAGKTLRFSKAVIATGARAVQPPIPGLADAGFLTNETVFSLTKRPARLAVIGAGPIGCELAQAFQRLGSQVTLIEQADQLLPREDADAAALVAKALQADGVQFRFNAAVQGVTRRNHGTELQLGGLNDPETLVVDAVLIGAGRAPNVEGLNLEGAGVRYDLRQGVLVDDTLRTANRRILAAGDVCMAHKFTHSADAAARIVLQNALFFGRKKLSVLTIPWCTYTAPEIAHVGLSEHEALQRGIAMDTVRVSMADVDRAVLDGETDGLLKVHLKKGTDRILGATLVARHAGDMISELTLAMVNQVGLGAIAGVIHPYPTQAEIIKKAADAYRRTKLTPTVQRWFTRLAAWQR